MAYPIGTRVKPAGERRVFLGFGQPESPAQMLGRQPIAPNREGQIVGPNNWVHWDGLPAQDSAGIADDDLIVIS